METTKQVSVFLENKPGRLANVLSALAREKINITALTVMDSHDNSDKDPARQPAVATALADQIAAGNRAIVGVMIESFLVAGRQDLDGHPGRPLTYGQSITDGCIGWDTTVDVLDGLADAVRARRAVD